MHRLYVLGRVDLLNADGTEVQSVLAQPRRLAVLVYLVLTSPNGTCRRDKLLGLFWPEFTQERARKALNKAIHYLRQALGDEAIVARNAEELAVDANRVWCDATAFVDATHREGTSEALELYRGELLPGFYIEEGVEFEAWVDSERTRLRRLAARAAHSLAQRHEKEGQFTTAIGLARRAVEMADDDERAVRDLLGLLDRLGDRAGALYAHDKFARRLATEFGAEPAAETRVLIDGIRARSEPASMVHPDQSVAAYHESPTAVVPRGLERMWTMAGVAVLAAATGLIVMSLTRPLPVYVPGRVIALPLENLTGDPKVADFAWQFLLALPEAIAREGVGEPVPAATVRELLSRAPKPPGRAAQWMTRETKAGLQLQGSCFPTSGATTCQLDILRMPAKVLRMSVSLTGDPTRPAFGAALMDRLLAALFLQHTWGNRVTWQGEYVPRSLAAVRAFREAWQREEWHYLGDAARLDTAWVEAAAWTADDSSQAAGDSLLARLARRPGLLPGEREIVAFRIAARHRDAEHAFDLALRRFDVNPEWWVIRATYWAEATGRSATAVSVSSYADSLVDADKRRVIQTKTMRGFALHHLGRYEEQLELAQEFERRFPTDVLYYRTHALMALAGLGRVDSIQTLLAKWEATPEPTDEATEVSSWAGTRSYIAGVELMAHGEVREGRAVLLQLLPLYRGFRQAGERHGELVEILLVTDRLEEARTTALADLRAAESPRDSIEALAALGNVAARQGRLDDAARYDSLLAVAGRREGFERDVLSMRAELAGWRGDRESAVRFLKHVNAWGLAEHRFAHRDPAFATLSDYPPFKEFLRPR